MHMDEKLSNNYIYGTYFEMNLNKFVRIYTEEERRIFLKKIEGEIQKEVKKLPKLYVQGFFKSPSYSDWNIRVHEWIEQYYRALLEAFAKNQEISIHIFNDVFEAYIHNKPYEKLLRPIMIYIVNQLEGIFVHDNLPEGNNYFLKIEPLKVAYITHLKTHVKAVVFEQMPEIMIKKHLEIYHIEYMVICESLKPLTPMSYELSTHTYKLNVHPVHRVEEIQMIDRERFQLGHDIGHPRTFDHYACDTIDFVLVDGSKVWLSFDSVFNLSEAKRYYKAVYQKFQNMNIIHMLPRLDIIYHFFDQANDPLLDEHTFKKHKHFYFLFIDAILLTAPDDVMLSLPLLSNDRQFDQIRNCIVDYVKKKYNKKIKIGLNIETETTHEHLKYFKKFDFAIIDIDRLFHEIFDISQGTFEQFRKQFYKELSYVCFHLKRRRREIYVQGELLKDAEVFKKLIKSGYKNFITYRMFVSLSDTLIVRYNQTRGLHRKVHKKPDDNTE